MSIHMATTLKPAQIDIAGLVSTASGNLLQAKPDGLYAALQAAPNLQNQYVSSSIGNDTNAGTRAAPLKTIWQAINNLPDNTSGTIWLLESDTFPMKVPSDPAWGATVSNFGSQIGTGNRTINFRPYGAFTDSYAGKEVNVTNFYSWILPALPRPTLEFGHFVFNGKPVGNVFMLGSAAGGYISLWGCNIAWTAAARAATTAAGTPWASAGYQWLLDCANVSIMGCTLPGPILTSGGATLNHVVRMLGTVALWNTSVPAGATPWATLGAVTKLTILDSGTMTDNTGATYTPVQNTSATNLGTRMSGIARDANNVPRNILSNTIL